MLARHTRQIVANRQRERDRLATLRNLVATGMARPTMLEAPTISHSFYGDLLWPFGNEDNSSASSVNTADLLAIPGAGAVHGSDGGDSPDNGDGNSEGEGEGEGEAEAADSGEDPDEAEAPIAGTTFYVFDNGVRHDVHVPPGAFAGEDSDSDASAHPGPSNAAAAAGATATTSDATGAANRSAHFVRVFESLNAGATRLSPNVFDALLRPSRHARRRPARR